MQFGKVYKGIWRNTLVAVKSMILPAKMSGADKRQRMAIMEVRHPTKRMAVMVARRL